MTKPQDSQADSIRARAIDWFVQMDGRQPTHAEAEALKAWLAADSRHRQAYGQVQQMWRELGMLEREAPLPLPLPLPLSLSMPQRRMGGIGAVFSGWRMAATASALAALALVALIFDLPMRLRADARTGIGEISEIMLPDGSKVTLGANSAIGMDYTAQRRGLRLLRGEALFEVAADAERPFEVLAAEGIQRALGTAFTVRLLPDGADVTALEHQISVSYPASSKNAVTLSPGQRLRYGERIGLGQVRPGDTAAAAAWARGKLVYVDQPLHQVIDELNRYYKGRIVISDRTLASRRISGVFETKDPLATLDAIERSLHLQSSRYGWLILLHN
ncbi:FecR domain-containing protein [Ferrovibrio sp.]|uniref:FecR family protein n=1 Tax=Ferrovibrio sp. TaxID=1917215 RepID=UPI0035B411FA